MVIFKAVRVQDPERKEILSSKEMDNSTEL